MNEAMTIERALDWAMINIAVHSICTTSPTHVYDPDGHACSRPKTAQRLGARPTIVKPIVTNTERG